MRLVCLQMLTDIDNNRLIIEEALCATRICVALRELAMSSSNRIPKVSRPRLAPLINYAIVLLKVTKHPIVSCRCKVCRDAR
jgi:hypothetical protein